MKVHYLILSSAIFLVALVGEVRSAEDCVSCGQKEVSGMPASGKKIGVMEKIAKKAAETQAPHSDYMVKYCLQFKQLDQESIGLMIEEIEETPYPVDEYFKKAACNSKGYSTSVKSPMIHLVADDPNAKEESFKNVELYYRKGRKKPEIFTEALNSKNTLGETFLDYIVSLRKKEILTHPDQQAPLDNIIKLACEYGAVYSKYKDKKCPVSI